MQSDDATRLGQAILRCSKQQALAISPYFTLFLACFETSVPFILTYQQVLTCGQVGRLQV